MSMNRRGARYPIQSEQISNGVIRQPRCFIRSASRREPDLDLHPGSDSHDDGERIVHPLHAAAQSEVVRGCRGFWVCGGTGSVSMMTRRSFGGGEKALTAEGAMPLRVPVHGTLVGGEGEERRVDRGSSEEDLDLEQVIENGQIHCF